MKTKPTSKFYGLFQYIFDYYNQKLFESKIKECVIVITRRKDVFGHFAHKRWFSNIEQETDELAINPTMIAKFPLIECCQTIVHEMTHAWQFHYGTPSRKGYHNKEWAQKMESIGLMPSHTGKPYGKKTGQNMADYPISKGMFLSVSQDLMNSQIFEGLFLEVSPDLLDQIKPEEPLFEQIKDFIIAQDETITIKNKKIKYSCDCSNIWGKPKLEITCKLCNKDFKVNT